jgi:hypothetical protein
VTKKPDVAAIGESDTVKHMPSRFALKSMNAIHKTLLAVSFGRVGWNAGNMPVCSPLPCRSVTPG